MRIILLIMEFDFDPEKNARLFAARGITFSMVVEAVHERGVLLNISHPNQKLYPGQRMLVVEISGYTYCVPYEVRGETWYLRTAYPSRKFKYLLEGGSHG